MNTIPGLAQTVHVESNPAKESITVYIVAPSGYKIRLKIFPGFGQDVLITRSPVAQYGEVVATHYFRTYRQPRGKLLVDIASLIRLTFDQERMFALMNIGLGVCESFAVSLGWRIAKNDTGNDNGDI